MKTELEEDYSHLNISEERMINNFGEIITHNVKKHPNVLVCKFTFDDKQYLVGYDETRNNFYTTSKFPDESAKI